MKHLKIFAFLLASMLFLGTAQAQADVTMADVLEAFNAQYPMDAGNGMTVESCTFDGVNLVTNISMEDDAQGVMLKVMEENMKDQKDAIIAGLGSQPGMKELVEILEELGTGMTYVYKGKNSKKSVEVSLTLEDLKSAFTKPSVGVLDNSLEGQLKMANSVFPMTIQEGFIIRGIFREGDNVMMVYELEDKATYDQVCAKVEDTKNSLKTNPSMAAMIGLCKENKVGMGVRFELKGKTDKCEAVIPYSEL